MCMRPPRKCGGFFYAEGSIILDWIFEGTANWIANTVTQLLDLVTFTFLGALGTDLTVMEE